MLTGVDIETGIPQVPAPWNLRGNGYIFLMKFPPAFVAEHGFVPPVLLDKFVGGVGAVMLVDYVQSDAGPYRELLFIPGQFRMGRRRYYAITKIYVSTQSSVINGRQNWGIPKELAGFEFQQVNEHLERVVVHKDGSEFAKFLLRTGDFSVPFTTSVMPAGLRTLVQIYDGKTYFTAPGGQGQLALTHLIGAEINADSFPDLNHGRLLAAVKAVDFSLCFPLAQIEDR
ncbi:MAG: acetoacetate decarboxylase family protein, partial [Anaerolineae bacterium]|nr:acetoacetate decarboxylase family protein [Anaerolineae bacterium]